jgi:EAL domain-containing protein (putative c-di-GMP-specific phosphodiesterase class I)
VSEHLLYIRLLGADRFEDIHGGEIAGRARAELSRRFAALARDLLRQHVVLSQPESPAFGTWLTPFELSRLEIDAGEAEQLESIVRAGRELVRRVLEEELGAATTLHARFDVGTIPLGGVDRGAAGRMRRLEALPRIAEPPAPRDERRALLDIIARPMEIRLQSIVSTATRGPVAFEALARGPVDSPYFEPDLLFEAAARAGLRAELELACLHSAVELAARLPAFCRLAVNLSPDLFGAPAVQRLASIPGLPKRLILEITEHLPIASPDRLLERTRALRRNGAKLALDDAGCGFLNMELVRALKPDIVKLCITVTRRIGGGAEVLELVRRTVAAIRAEGAEALAEGVETETQALLARECGCALAQGFLFDKPRTLAELMAAAAVAG